MGRPATGTKTALPDGRVRAEFLKRSGAPERWRHTFPNGPAADRWLAVCRDALSAGLPTPDPRLQTHAPRPSRPRIATVPELLRTFENAARLWLEEYYETMRRGGPERQRAAQIHLDSHIRPYLNQQGVTLVSDIDHQMITEFASCLAGQHLSPRSTSATDPLDEVLVNRQQLIQQAARSQSTVQRALGSQVPAVDHDDRGRPLYSLGAARRAGLLGDRPPRWGVDKAYASDILATLQRILQWAHDHGWIDRVVGEKIRSVRPDEAVALPRKGRKRGRRHPVITLPRCAAAVQHLDFVDVVAMWTQRLLGTRLHESFGPLVCDLEDHGDYGILNLDAQGGRQFKIRDEHGRVITVERKKQLKNAESVRRLLVPKTLMDLYRILIEAYHTDEDGIVDVRARLIPGRRSRNAAGAQTYASNLKAAFAAVADPAVDGDHPVTSHQLRASLATDLRWSREELDEITQKRFLGHGSEDVHDRHYVLEHPSMEPQKRVAEAIDQMVIESLGHLRLQCRPTKWAKWHAFYDRRHQIDQMLRSYGLLADNDDQMTTGQLAEQLEVGRTTVRRWLREGQIEGATKVEGQGPVHYRASATAVQAHLEAPTLTGSRSTPLRPTSASPTTRLDSCCST